MISQGKLFLPGLVDDYDDNNDDRNDVNDNHADHDDISVKEDGESCSYPDWFTTHRRYHSLSGTRSAIVIIIIIILVIVIIIIFVIFNVIFIIMMMILWEKSKPRER